MSSETDKILSQLFIDRDWLAEITLAALVKSGLCNVDCLAKKECQQSVDFFEIFEAHMYYADIKPKENASDDVLNKTLLTGCVKIFYAGVCEVTQEKLSGKRINELNNPEFDMYLRYRVKHDTVGNIISKELPELDDDHNKFVEFLTEFVHPLKQNHKLSKCIESYNTERIFSKVYDAGVTYAKSKMKHP